jgi:hypothetical protein
MSSFEEMARAAREKSQAETDAIAVRRAQAAADEKARYEAAVSMLERKVMPIMTEARDAFAKIGVPATIHPNWTGETRYIEPSVAFRVEGPETHIPATGGSFNPAGRIVVAKVAEGQIVVGLGTTVHDNFGASRQKGDVEVALAGAIKKSIESYYESIEAIHRQFGRP